MGEHVYCFVMGICGCTKALHFFIGEPVVGGGGIVVDGRQDGYHMLKRRGPWRSQRIHEAVDGYRDEFAMFSVRGGTGDCSPAVSVDGYQMRYSSLSLRIIANRYYLNCRHAFAICDWWICIHGIDIILFSLLSSLFYF